jgi:hypothetical protein
LALESTDGDLVDPIHDVLAALVPLNRYTSPKLITGHETGSTDSCIESRIGNYGCAAPFGGGTVLPTPTLEQDMLLALLVLTAAITAATGSATATLARPFALVVEDPILQHPSATWHV